MDLEAKDLSDMDPTEPDERFAQDVEEQVVRQLRLNHPYMDVDAIAATASSCHDVIMSCINKQLPMMKQSRSRIGFLDLPAEIRNQIYEPVIVGDKAKHCNLYKVWKDAIRQPALSKTCRQVREETLSLFYTANKFEFKFEVDFGSINVIYEDLSKGLQAEEIVRTRMTNLRASYMGAVFAWLKSIGAHHVSKISHLMICLDNSYELPMPLRRLEANRVGIQQVFERFGEEMAFALPPKLSLITLVWLEPHADYRTKWAITTLEFTSDQRLAHKHGGLEPNAGMEGIADGQHSVEDDGARSTVGEAGATSRSGEAECSEKLSSASEDKVNDGQSKSARRVLRGEMVGKDAGKRLLMWFSKRTSRKRKGV